MPVEPEKRRATPWLRAVLLLAIFIAFSLAWRWTPINRWINLRVVVQWLESIRNHPAAFYYVVGAYLLGGLVLFPVTLLNVATIFTFGPIRGNAYALAGWLASAAMGYGIGRALGRETVRRIIGARINALLDKAAGHGFLTVLAIRILPVAPFTLANLFVGASAISLRDFLLASVVGRIPGMVLQTFAGFQVERVLRRPGVGSVMGLLVILVLLSLVAAWLSKHFKKTLSRRQNSQLQ
jgi:phospholipase D1/2